jgi:amino acid transporter
MRLAGGGTASRVISGMVMVSALGAMHGMIFAGCRLLAAVGQDHQLFRGWNRWSDRHVPVGSLLTISGVSLLLTMLAGTPEGRKGIDMIVRACWLPPPNWQDFGGGFELLVAASAPIFWGFFLLSGLSLFVLRLREPQRALPFHVPLYPVTPLLFCATAAFMLYSSGQYAGRITLLTLPALAIGLLLPLGGRTPEADQSSASGSSSDAGSSAGG